MNLTFHGLFGKFVKGPNSGARVNVLRVAARFLKDLAAKGRVFRYVQAVAGYVGTLIKECRWEHLKDVTAESFTVWRQNQAKAPKTLNEYLMGARVFFNWMVRQKLTKENPLADVELVRVDGFQKRVRRAYAPQEVRSLLAVAGERMPVYLMAVLTGLRRGELLQLRWADLDLAASAPSVKVRASISKNHREAVLPLHCDLVEVLRELRPAECNPESFIFKGLLPRTKRFRADLKAAGIDGQDKGWGRLDFHSFRVTYCTELGSLVGSERVRMELMRHHDPRLTAETYTDARMLPLGDAVAKLSFLTLTFADHVTNLRQAQRRFRSLRAHVIVKRYERAIVVWERHQSGRILFHLVVVLAEDIRTGADFAAFNLKDYRSANAALRAEWAFWRVTCPKYRFGRHELMPIKSNAEGIARYVGKYISKHIGQRLEEDKGARLVRFIGYKTGDRSASCLFSWNSENAWLWRHKVAAFAKRHGVADLDGMRRTFGPRWAYQRCREILAEPLEGVVFPSESAAMKSLDTDLLMARYKTHQIIEARPVTRTVLDQGESFNGWPVWAVPASFGETVAETPLSPEIVAAGEERARELRLYAARREVQDGHHLWKWE